MNARTSGRRPSVAIIDTWATEAYPSGKCSRALAGALARDHDVTVFSLAFDDPTEGGVHFVKVRAVRWPAAVLLPTFWVSVGVAYGWRRLRGWRPAVVVAVEGFSPVANVRYAHFCHAAYHRQGDAVPGLRGLIQRITSRMHVTSERFAYRGACRVVAVSDGLADELRAWYPTLRDTVEIIPNFIDVERLQPPADLERDAMRSRLGVGPHERLLVFVAIGHFERKGLPEVLAALARVRDEGHPLALVVVGGFPDRLRELTAETERVGVADLVRFVGMVDDPRPFYWAADAFVLPSRYETFSFVAFEAAASGLPLVATPVYGVRDILRDGLTGWQVSPDVESVTNALRGVATAPQDELRARGDRARNAVADYGRAGFERRWRAVISEVAEPVADEDRPGGAE